ncbi:ferredoxin-NADP reductase [Candidatus Izimaplasma bacterium ZiA1]|uniref:sulfide/dihydroorotate dehydrogenase-like FAD/NAD-binding protein n=1 Tax=Candidatus Izimoplasma sp. ZiA1 TaxID=2024899 RepID=UPI000BAA5A3C|nr:ferredoxin-NADP reductase [Candidatus Izimaplasma bacterium ZiA1]
MYEIISKKVLNKDVDLMQIKAPLVAKNAKPGHFIILRVDENGERIPLTITEVSDDLVTIIYQKLGFSTRLLGKLQVGDSISDFVGPLGKASHIVNEHKIIGVAGGVGAAPLFPQLKEYKRLGKHVTLVIGARSKEHIILLDDYKEFCDEIYIATDNGSLGQKGFVTDVLQTLYQTHTYDHAIAIGPLVMMKSTVELNKKHGIKTDVSLNPIMIDGTGMCGNCRVSIGGKTFFACVDGPDFPGEEVDFDELIARQSYYKDEEHICNLGLE